MSSILSCSLQTLSLMSKDALSHLEKPGSTLTSHPSASFLPGQWSSQYKHLSFSTCKVLVIEQYTIYNHTIFRSNNSVVWSIKMAVPTSFTSFWNLDVKIQHFPKIPGALRVKLYLQHCSRTVQRKYSSVCSAFYRGLFPEPGRE